MYSRYVALGDSQTEGLMDGDEVRGYRGWADRLAGQLAVANPELRYANLAVRGQLAHQVRSSQLAHALALRPDLATVMAGVNDMLRRRFDAAAVFAELESMFEALVGIGARVVTVTFPDPARMVPAARFLTARTLELNEAIRAAAGRHGVTVADMVDYPVCSDPRLWSVDRLHLSTLGHTRLAGAVAHALDLPDNADWADPLAPQAKPPLWRRVENELRWTANFVGPWLVRRIRGRSSGDGHVAKRPELAPISDAG